MPDAVPYIRSARTSPQATRAAWIAAGILFGAAIVVSSARRATARRSLFARISFDEHLVAALPRCRQILAERLGIGLENEADGLWQRLLDTLVDILRMAEFGHEDGDAGPRAGLRRRSECGLGGPRARGRYRQHDDRNVPVAHGTAQAEHENEGQPQCYPGEDGTGQEPRQAPPVQAGARFIPLPAPR